MEALSLSMTVSEGQRRSDAILVNRMTGQDGKKISRRTHDFIIDVGIC